MNNSAILTSYSENFKKVFKWVLGIHILIGLVGVFGLPEFNFKKRPDITIELVNFYAGVHIDSTICPLRDGFVVLNASRVTPQNCPKAFDGWTKLWVNDVEAQNFHEYPYASKWIGMNMLSIDPNTVIVDRAQVDLIEDLEQAKFTVIPLELRHSRTLGGGFHCVTLDLVRE
jgi:N-dimethylarginine dimethylaminohydrolase